MEHCYHFKPYMKGRHRSLVHQNLHHITMTQSVLECFLSSLEHKHTGQIWLQWRCLSIKSWPPSSVPNDRPSSCHQHKRHCGRLMSGQFINPKSFKVGCQPTMMTLFWPSYLVVVLGSTSLAMLAFLFLFQFHFRAPEGIEPHVAHYIHFSNLFAFVYVCESSSRKQAPSAQMADVVQCQSSNVLDLVKLSWELQLAHMIRVEGEKLGVW